MRLLALQLSFCLYGVVCGLLKGPAFAQSETISSQILKQYSSATVYLAVRGAKAQTGEDIWVFGSGFIISSDGYLLTAAHNVEDADRQKLKDIKVLTSIGTSFDKDVPTGIILPAELIKTDDDIDVALMQLPKSQTYNFVHLCGSAGLEAGDRIHSLGFILGQSLSVNSGTLTSKDGPRGLWRTDILVNQGSSGGPVFEDKGHVIGLVKGGLPSVPGNNFIVPVNFFADLAQRGLAMIDDCRGAPSTVQGKVCDQRVVVYDISFTKEDHPTIQKTTARYERAFQAEPDYTIESAQWIGGSQNHANDPELIISSDKRTLRFSTVVESGPFFDQWRGWITGKVVTQQKARCP